MKDTGKGKELIILFNKILNGIIAFFKFIVSKTSEFIIKSDFKRKFKSVISFLQKTLIKCKDLFLLSERKISEFITKSDFKGKYKAAFVFLKKVLVKCKEYIIIGSYKFSEFIIKLDLKNKFKTAIIFLRKILIKCKEFIIWLVKEISELIIRFDIKTKLIITGKFIKKVLVKIAAVTVLLWGKTVLFIKSLEIKKNLTKFISVLKLWIIAAYQKFIALKIHIAVKQFSLTIWIKIVTFVKNLVSKIHLPEKINVKDFYRKTFSVLTIRKITLYAIILIVIDILLMWFISFRVLYAKHYWQGPEEKHFVIKTRENVDELLNDLKDKDIISSKQTFKILLRLTGKDDNIISRRYVIKNGVSNSELINILVDRNFSNEDKFTVIEGYRIKQIAKIAANKLQLSPEKFIQATENDSLINILGLKGKINNLEGFLFPDTYILPPDLDEKGLVEILFNEFRRKVLNNSDIENKFLKSNKDILSVMTMASIIQGETNIPAEMPVISGVYYNRLRIRMRLEADPTVQYVLPDGPKKNLLFEDLKIDSPYNTYKHYGLPPGPINNPGLYAIKAAINPDKNDYLFFVATGVGGHKFSSTYQEHLKAIEEYKKNRTNIEPK
jgi:UPF0755 protein